MSKDGPRIDADELDRKASYTRPQQIFCGHFSERTWTAQGLRAQSPQIPEQENTEQKFVDGRRMDPAIKRLTVIATDFGAGNKPIEKAHAPWNIGRSTVIAVAGNQAAYASNGIA